MGYKPPVEAVAIGGSPDIDSFIAMAPELPKHLRPNIPSPYGKQRQKH